MDIPQQYCYIRTLRRLNISDNEIIGLDGPIHFWINLQVSQLVFSTLSPPLSLSFIRSEK